MKHISYIFLLIAFYFQFLVGFSQNFFQKTEHIKSQISEETDVFKKLSLYDSLISEYHYKDNTTALYYELEAIQLASSSKNDSLLVNTYEKFSLSNHEIGNNKQAIQYGEKAIELCLQLKDTTKTANLYLQQEVYYDLLGDYASSMDMAQKAQVLFEKTGDILGTATCLNDIGIVHYYLGQDSTALEYLKESLDLHLSVNDSSGIANCYNNIANIYSDRGEYEKSLSWYFKGLEIDKSLNKLYGQSITLSNIGETYLVLKEYEKAEKHLKKSLEIAQKTGDAWTITNPLRALSDFYLSQKDYENALIYAKTSIHLSDSIGALSELSEGYFMLSEIYKSKKSFEPALTYFEKYKDLQDSIFNKDNAMLINELESKYQSDKKNSEIRLLTSQNKIESLIHKEEIEKRNRQMAYWVAGAVIFIVLSLLILWSLISNKRANASLTRQKLIIEEKNATLNTALEEIEEKNKEITDSINYAKRIQSAILPPSSLIKYHLNDSFVLYNPKDIVAGDFYWMETVSSSSFKEEVSRTEQPDTSLDTIPNTFGINRDDRAVLFAVADCTGHGVPGAMVSVICNNALNRSVQEFGLSSTNEILDKTNEIVSEQFGQSEESVKDGMDIALCKLDTKNLTLEFSGANNPLWIATKNMAFYNDIADDPEQVELYKHTEEQLGMIEIKPDKQPIGLFARKTPFQKRKIKVQKGDLLYIFSDGYVDQFGGEKGKKFKHKNFKKLLLSLLDTPTTQQESILQNHFLQWRGEIEQIDDVCVIGVRV